MRKLCRKCLNPPGCSWLRLNSPAWPNGVWPRSWPSAMASVRYSLSERQTAMVRAICETSSTWVSRVR